MLRIIIAICDKIVLRIYIVCELFNKKKEGS